MNAPARTNRDESRWPPAIAIFVVLCLLAALPHHVYVLPVWGSYLAALAILMPMAAVALTKGNRLWLRIERMMIILLSVVYVGNTIAELAIMIGVITSYSSAGNAFSLLSSSVAIWVANVLTFSLLYWQIDRGGPYGRVSGLSVKSDWLFPEAAAPEEVPPEWRPLFVDYLYLGYNTATAFSATDVLPLTHRAKVMMMIESAISLLTSVIILSRAINVLPT